MEMHMILSVVRWPYHVGLRHARVQRHDLVSMSLELSCKHLGLCNGHEGYQRRVSHSIRLGGPGNRLPLLMSSQHLHDALCK